MARNMIATVHPSLFFFSSPFCFIFVSLDFLMLWGSSACCGDAESVNTRDSHTAFLDGEPLWCSSESLCLGRGGEFYFELENV